MLPLVLSQLLAGEKCMLWMIWRGRICLLQKYIFRIIWDKRWTLLSGRKKKPQFFFFFNPQMESKMTTWTNTGFGSLSSSCHRLSPRLHTLKTLLLRVKFMLQDKWNNFTQNLPGGLGGWGPWGDIELNFALEWLKRPDLVKHWWVNFQQWPDDWKLWGGESSRKPFTAMS